jgi:hypothetical protein
MSLIEMLATLMIMSIAAVGITEIAVTQNVVAFRTYNKLDALTNARRVASFIERDVHNAKFIGYIFNSNPNQFLGPPSYSLNAQTLILQTPVFYSPASNGGFPALPTQSSIPNHWNVDTVVYQVVGDSARAGTGQFVLQKTVYPGNHSSGYEPAPTASTQTILTGIVGPVDLTALADPVALTPPPKIFGFFPKSYPMYVGNFPSGVQPDATDINGVSINLELCSDAASKRVDLVPRSMAFRTEIYMRGNFSSPSNYYQP